MGKSFAVSSPELKNVEDVLESLGGFGRFQILILVLLLSMEIPTAFVVFSPIFSGVNPAVWYCDDLAVSRDDICSCNGTRESAVSSIVTEWELICDLSWVSDFTTTLQMFGGVFGSYIFGPCADWYGRRLAFLASVSTLVLGTVVSAVASNVYIFSIARFVVGAGFSGYMALSGTYTMEFMTPDWRVLCASAGPFGEGIMLLGVLAYYFQDSWRNLLWATVAPFLLMLIIFPLVPESPRWLLRNQKVEKAHQVFKYIGRVNGKPNVEIDVLHKICANENTGNEAQTKKDGYTELLKNKELRFITICLMVIWATWAIMYFGISFNIKNFGGNPYQNVIWMGLCDAIGYPASYFLNCILTRRKTLAAFMSSAAIFLVGLAIVQLVIDTSNQQALILWLCLGGKFSAAAARACARTLSGESFPTTVRNIGMSLIGISACVTSLLAPQLAYLGTRWPAIPLFTFAICSLGGAGCSFLLQETKGQPLKEEVEKLDRKISISSIAASLRRFSFKPKVEHNCSD